ncbi:MerR family transcriptional regulator [Helicobacter sp. 23-1044]
MAYTIKQVESITKVSCHTLRYWAKMGLFSHIERDDNGYRYFSERDLQWVGLVQCMRQTGMSIAKVREFVELSKRGDSSLNERIAMLQTQRSEILSVLESYQNALNCIDKKIAILEAKSDLMTPGKSKGLRKYYDKDKQYKSLKDNASSKVRVRK